MGSSVTSSRRNLAEFEHSEWQGRTDGTPWMQRMLIALIRVLPLWLMYGVMGLVIPFYMLFGGGFRPSYAFFRKRIGYGPLKSFLHVYSNEFGFGMVVLDRFAVYAGKKFKVDEYRKDIFDRLEKEDGGFMMLSSHTGCFEMAGYMFTSKLKKVHALVYPGESGTIAANRGRVFSSTNVEMVPVQPDLSHVFTLNSALADGQIVTMPGDRVYGSGKTVRAEFFGAPASFPAGPFTLAAQRNVPVISVFVMKDGYRRYRVYIEELAIDREASRAEQVSAMAQAYASRMESIVREYPDQWYNFFDFWK